MREPRNSCEPAIRLVYSAIFVAVSKCSLKTCYSRKWFFKCLQWLNEIHFQVVQNINGHIVVLRIPNQLEIIITNISSIVLSWHIVWSTFQRDIVRHCGGLFECRSLVISWIWAIVFHRTSLSSLGNKQTYGGNCTFMFASSFSLWTGFA